MIPKHEGHLNGLNLLGRGGAIPFRRDCILQPRPTLAPLLHAVVKRALSKPTFLRLVGIPYPPRLVLVAADEAFAGPGAAQDLIHVSPGWRDRCGVKCPGRRYFPALRECAMFQIILDASTSSKLNNVFLPVELCDPSGRVLGRFEPLIDPSEWEPVSPEVSEEELRRREQSDKRYTTEQVLAHLKNLEQP